jgi:hypothetical protein
MNFLARAKAAVASVALVAAGITSVGLATSAHADGGKASHLNNTTMTAHEAALGATSTKSTTSRVFRACKAVAQRDYTRAQLRVCKQHPSWARRTPDPRKHRVVSGTPDSRAALDKAIAQGKIAPMKSGDCPLGSRAEDGGHAFTKHSMLGSTIYTWHFWMSDCFNPGSDGVSGHVTKVYNLRDWFTNTQSIVQVKEVVSQAKGITEGTTGCGNPKGCNTGWGSLERHVQLCALKYGCYADRYPHAKLTRYGFLDSFGYSGTAD